MSDFLFYVSLAANVMMLILIWVLSSAGNELKECIKQLEEVVDRKQERYDSLRERYNKLSEMKDEVVNDAKNLIKKQEDGDPPKHLWVFYSSNESHGVSITEGDVRKEDFYRKFLKWFYSTEKPTFTFYYSNGGSTTIMRKLITHFKVK